MKVMKWLFRKFDAWLDELAFSNVPDNDEDEDSWIVAVINKTLSKIK